jgi:hypothetical protein
MPVSTLCNPFYIKYYAQVGNILNDDSDRSVDPDDWAAAVNSNLKEYGGDILSVTELASYFLSHLVVACRVQCNICWP